MIIYADSGVRRLEMNNVLWLAVAVLVVIVILVLVGVV